MNHREIPNARFGEFVKRFAKKLDLEAPDFEVLGEATHPRRPKSAEDTRRIADRDPTYPVDVFTKVSITGDAPTVPGFRFVGKIEPSDVPGINFVAGVPESGVDPAFVQVRRDDVETALAAMRMVDPVSDASIERNLRATKRMALALDEPRMERR